MPWKKRGGVVQETRGGTLRALEHHGDGNGSSGGFASDLRRRRVGE
jgi:hypothetical protein